MPDSMWIFDLSTIKSRFANIGLIDTGKRSANSHDSVKATVAGLVDGIKYWKTNPEVR